MVNIIFYNACALLAFGDINSDCMPIEQLNVCLLTSLLELLFTDYCSLIKNNVQKLLSFLRTMFAGC